MHQRALRPLRLVCGERRAHQRAHEPSLLRRVLEEELRRVERGDLGADEALEKARKSGLSQTELFKEKGDEAYKVRRFMLAVDEGTS